MEKPTIIWTLSGILCIFLVLLIPVTQMRVISYGLDTYTAHKPMFSNHTYSQDITTSAKTIGIGIIAVDLYRSKQLSDIQVNIVEKSTNTLLASDTIPAQDVHDDSFAYATFPEQAITRNIQATILLSAPSATIRNPMGLRFDPQDDHLALALKERVPLWKAMVTIGNNRKEQWQYALGAGTLSLLVAVPALFQTKKAILWVIALGIMCTISYTVMMNIIPQFGGVSGGDAYNYLAITQTLSKFDNPFINTKRLPGYPLLLVPTYVSGAFDEQFVMRTFSATAGIWGIIMLACIARSLKLSWPVALASASILALQKDYLWTAMRPEPYAFYTALLLTSTYLFITNYKRLSAWRYVLFGLFLGYSAMTRQEGFVFATVLGTLSLACEIWQVAGKKESSRASTQRFILMYAPALLLVLPFFVSNFVHYGSPFYVQYLEGDRLQIVDSFLAFQDALGATWGIIGSMWKTAWTELERLPLSSPIFIASSLGLWAWYAITRFFENKKTKIVLSIILFCTWIFIVIGSVYIKSTIVGIITPMTAGLVIASIPIFLIETTWKGFAIFLILLSQIGIATWFHPFAKHYQQSYPLIVLIIGTALLARVPKKGFFTGMAMATAVLPFFVIAIFLSQKLNTAIDKQNEDTALDSVTYRAARYARTLPGPIGFDQAYLPARLYFDPEAKYFPDEDMPTPQMEQEWLTSNPVKTLVVSNGNNVFKSPDPKWNVLKTFKAAGDDEKIFESTVYDTGN